MIIIDERTNVDTLASLYRKLEDGSQDVYLTRKRPNNEFGLVPQIIQFLASWFIHNDGKIIIDVEVAEDLAEMDTTSNLSLDVARKYFSDFYDLDYFYPVVIYCWSRNIEDKKGKNIKKLLRRTNEWLNDRMHRQDVGKGPKSLLMNIDHVPKSKGLLQSFYRGDEFIEDEFSFDFALEKPVKRLLSQNAFLAKNSIAKNRQELIEAIYELMKNTHEWGRNSITNAPLKQSIRGLYLDFHYLTIAQFHQKNAGFPGLVDYFSSKNFEPDGEQRLAFIEVSVFDTGIGFASQYSGIQMAEIPIEQQVDIVKRCLMVHNTSASGIHRVKKGRGLDRILQILNRKGIFLLRTGNSSLFRNLLTNHYSSDNIINSNDIELFDRDLNSSDQFKDFGKAIGSVVTLIYPLNDLVNA